MRLQAFIEKEILCQCARFCPLMANPSTPRGGTVNPCPVGLSQNARASAELCRELGTRWAEAFGPSAAGSSLSSPGISDAPVSQACIHLPLAFPDGLWEEQRSAFSNPYLGPCGENPYHSMWRKAQQSRARARGAGKSQINPRGSTRKRGSTLTTLFLHCQENLELDWKGLSSRINELAVSPSPSPGCASPGSREGKLRDCPHLVVRVRDRGRTLRLLT